MLQDGIKVTGALVVELRDESGKVKEVREIPNLVVTVGRYYLAQRAIDLAQPTAMSRMALGSSSTAPAPGDTTLGTELGRVTLTGNAGTVAANSNQIVYSATFPAGTATGTVREAGIFNAATAGVMLARTTFADVNKGANDSLAVTWTISIN